MTLTVSPQSIGIGTLAERYQRESGFLYLTGIQALARLPIDRARLDRRAGRQIAGYIAGYEGSPLGGYDLELGRQSALLAEFGILLRPALNEEIAATALVGTQLARGAGRLHPDGVTGIWYGKAPGLDRATDAFRHANLIGTDPRGGVVALVGDDPAAKSSSVPCVSEMALADLHVPTLYPADSQDLLELGQHAIELSRASGLWTALKVTTNVADGASTVALDARWTAPTLEAVGAYGHRPDGRVLGSNLLALERSLYEVRLPVALTYAQSSGINRIEGASAGNARIGIVAAGKTYLDVRQALAALGLDEDALMQQGIRLLKLGMVHPLESGVIRRFAAGVDEIVVVEEKRSFIEPAIKDVLYGSADMPRVHGKQGPDGRRLFPETGELDPDVIATGLITRLREFTGLGDLEARRRPEARRIALPLVAPSTARTPYFCSGCPHNSSTKVPDGSLVGAGIGCHAMVLLMPEQQVGDVVGMTQMGGEGAHWFGMAPFVDQTHFVQNLGDGTFAHSGSLALRAAVAAGVNITYKLLYNSTVAMTGGQQVVGAMSVPQLVDLLITEGVGKVVVTSDNPKLLRRRLPKGTELRPRADLLDVQRELASVPGVTVLIHEQECATEKRRKRTRGSQAAPTKRVMINERLCEGCGDCGRKSNCLSVQPVTTEFGRKTRIHQASCNVDYLCLTGDCPSFIAVRPTKQARVPKPVAIAAEELPPPVVDREREQVNIRISGVGGTGVVTAAQVLATAAGIDGRFVRSLDQTGLAQKGGPVVSDLKITANPELQANKLADSECDVYLGCDALTAADARYLRAADPKRTVSIVSTGVVPTGVMVVDPTAAYPDVALVTAPIERASAQVTYVDTHGLSERFFGDDKYANMVLLGVCVQLGAVPITPASIERALELNGVAVVSNVQAFRRGRAWAARGSANPVTDIGPAEQPELDRLLSIRVPELIAYQNERYASEYGEFVERVAAAEHQRVPGSTAIAEAVARNLYKLMAYKDEYEVARLALDPALQASIAEQFGEGASFSYQLHPPLLRSLGLRRKLSLGRWFRPGFRVLYALRGLRGTPLDLFGYTQVRRAERQLVQEYREVLDQQLQELTPATASTMAELAELPDLVRGYEDVKVRALETYHKRMRELLGELDRLA